MAVHLRLGSEGNRFENMNVMVDNFIIGSVVCSDPLQEQIIVDRPELPKDKVSSTLVADAVEARRWANTLLAGVANADADVIQVACLVCSWL